ncbi:MAG: hypothetical protein LW697_02335 [Blastopirellula sp.]|nr:hypothetical protein [Blastopirellula sp.]
MLRAAQLRVNRQTLQLDTIRGDRPIDGDLQAELRNIAELQAQLLEMAERIMDNEGDN